MSENSTVELRPCPRCGENIKAAARVCRFCGVEFDRAGAPLKKSAGWVKVFVWLGLIVVAGAVVIFSLSVGGRQIAADSERVWNVQRNIPSTSGLHCLDAHLNLLHPDLYVAVKNSLHDPASMRDMRMTVAPVAEDRTHAITFTFRALNRFGALEAHTVTATVTSAGCNLLSWQ